MGKYTVRTMYPSWERGLVRTSQRIGVLPLNCGTPGGNNKQTCWLGMGIPELNQDIIYQTFGIFPNVLNLLVDTFPTSEISHVLFESFRLQS